MLFLIFAYLLLAVFSIIIIDKGADWATDSLSGVAKKLKTTYVAVGLILVSIMVSLPEIIIAIYTTLLGHETIAMGVIIGSIICNIGLMTGISAMIRPLKVSKSLILRDGIFAVAMAIMVYILSIDGKITRPEGFAFLLLFIPYLINVWFQEKTEKEKQKEEELKEVVVELKLMGLDFGRIKSGIWSFVLGMGALLFGSYIFSHSLIQIAQLSHVSDLLIGLTLGAIGTSIPNIAAAIKATRKNIEEIAVSETLGSDIFTLLVSLGILSILKPIDVAIGWLRFDIPVMVGMSILMLIFMIPRQTISRLQGGILFGSYIILLLINIFINI
jgi:cation:H+ antiporter